MAKKEVKPKKKETIIVFGAHTDDFVIGAGGTIASYTKAGKKVLCLVFSYGEKSHPWIKEHVVQKFRSEEALQASEMLGCRTIFFDLREVNFYEDYQKKGLEKLLLKTLRKEKPDKIFTHSNEDPHPNHKDVHKITLELFEKLELKPELYIYSIWNPISLKTNLPSLYVNITKTFSLKLKALKTFKSQHIHITYPFFLLLFRAFKNGLKIKTLFGEKFYRIR